MSERSEETVTDETTPDATSGQAAVSTTPARSAPGGSAGDRTRRKVRVGVVVSDKMDKTVLVRIDRRVRRRAGSLHGRKRRTPHKSRRTKVA